MATEEPATASATCPKLYSAALVNIESSPSAALAEYDGVSGVDNEGSTPNPWRR